MTTKDAIAEIQAEYLDSLRPPPLSEDERDERDKRTAHAIECDRERRAKANRMLPAGTLVRAQISWLRGHVLVVTKDAGPVNNPERSIIIQRREPERADEIYRVKRNRVTAEEIPTQTPPPGETGASLMPGVIGQRETTHDDAER